MILSILSILFVCIVVVAGALVIGSKGVPKPFLDERGKPLEGSISEKIFITINGVEQGMFIKGKDKTKPVLLFVHGGPAMPEYAISQKYTEVLENYFTVCWWDQRGAGLSYNENLSPETITVGQLIDDTAEVTNYLRKRFRQEKIYLMGHSWGTFIGIQAAAKDPELYYAYIGMSQVSKQLQSEKLAYQYMKNQFKVTGDKRRLKKLEKYPIWEMDTLPQGYRLMRDDLMHSLGIGTTRKMKSVVTGIFLPIMQSPEYTLREKLNVWRGKIFANKATNLWDKMLETDLTREVKKLEVPVYFCEGIYDYTASYIEAKAYYHNLEAPLKGFYTFYQSAHSPMFEEPERFGRILQEDVLTGMNTLTDKK